LRKNKAYQKSAGWVEQGDGANAGNLAAGGSSDNKNELFSQKIL